MSDHSEVLYVLCVALVGIRATENIEKACILADVEHNVPTMVRAGSPEEKVAAKVMLTAKRQGIEGYFSELFEMAKQK